MTETTDATDLRRRIYDAARTPAIRLTESTLKLAQAGGVFHLNSTEADEIARAVMDLIEPVLAEAEELRRQLADTPTTQAAIAQLRAWVPDYDPGATHVAMPVATARKLLAALDDAQRPCSHTWNGHIDTSESGTTIHLGGYSGDGKLLAAHARARDLAADLTNALDEQQAQADARTDGWG